MSKKLKLSPIDWEVIKKSAPDLTQKTGGDILVRHFGTYTNGTAGGVTVPNIVSGTLPYFRTPNLRGLVLRRITGYVFRFNSGGVLSDDIDFSLGIVGTNFMAQVENQESPMITPSGSFISEPNQVRFDFTRNRSLDLFLPVAPDTKYQLTIDLIPQFVVGVGSSLNSEILFQYSR